MLHTERTDGVLTVTLDDGKRNAITPAMCQALIDVLDDAGDASAIVLTGRDGTFSAGLDRDALLGSGRASAERLLVAFGHCLMRWWTDPRPTVAAATGHALAGGTLLAMTCDQAIAAQDGAWGLVETQVGVELPVFAITLARHHLRTDRFEDLLLPGARIDAATAVEVGFADEVLPADQVLDRAVHRATELAALPARAYAGTKRRLRQADADAVLAGLDADIDALLSSW